MRRYGFWLLLVAGFDWCEQPAHGAEPGCAGWRAFWQPLGHPCPCCPDAYCPKARPPVPCPVPCRGPDAYCPKPLPVPCPFKYRGVNEYCPKPCPILSPCYPPWYTCGPGSPSN
jgi:hypothetical protein